MLYCILVIVYPKMKVNNLRQAEKYLEPCVDKY